MRKSGILMPVFSLPSVGGIGTFGKAAYEFVDFLRASGQTLWQILPLGPTSYGDSPYQSFSTFAGNPYFIDLEMLCNDGLLSRDDFADESTENNPRFVDYGSIYKTRFKILRAAYRRFRDNIPPDFWEFCNRNAGWLEGYALFMSLKGANGGRSWREWERSLAMHEESAVIAARDKYTDDILFHKTLQYLFHKQWTALKEYANSFGIEIIGDIPIYVSLDSADVWENPQLFQLDADHAPVAVAGCPPDAFSKTGQLWGNPLFDWEAMKKDGYAWWKKRIKSASQLYDIIRIDHFRGLDSYYSVPYGDKTAENGKWVEGPGYDFVREIKQNFKGIRIIAEDLGFLTPSVKRLLKKSGFPGMKILQFAFDSREESDYLPHNYTRNCVVYTGTHDNDTVLGWFAVLPRKDRVFARRYLRLSRQEGYNWGLMRGAWSSVADTAIVTMQDILSLGTEARINTPSLLGPPNWCWRAKREDFDPLLAEKIYEQMEIYKRLPKKTKGKR